MCRGCIRVCVRGCVKGVIEDVIKCHRTGGGRQVVQ